MRAVVLKEGQYSILSCPEPVTADNHQVLIKVAYAGVNRADLLQKQGRYPLPEGKYAVPGMEVSGEIAAYGKNVKHLKVGDRVCALLKEGGYAEYVAADEALILPIPQTISMEEAACLPEACFTAWISLVWQGKVQVGERVLIHGGTSGIGIIAIQIAKILGAEVFSTAGSAEKCTLCEGLGAKTINYKGRDFVAVIKELTQGEGVDVIMDMVGGDYLERNLQLLKHNGRLSIIAFMNGAKSQVNFSPVLLKHLTVMGSTLRSRPLAEKARIAEELRDKIWPKLPNGGIKPVIDHIFDLEEAEKALDRMDKGLNIGKILLRCGSLPSYS